MSKVFAALAGTSSAPAPTELVPPAEYRAKRGLYLAPFDELADPSLLVDLAVRAEEHGWDGVFLWDHILWKPPVRAVGDAWVALSAIAARTRHIRLGPLVTPLSRRRVHKVARETATLDRLSHGRLILGAGLGASNNNELEQFGEVVDPRERARRLDDGPRAHSMSSSTSSPGPIPRPGSKQAPPGSSPTSARNHEQQTSVR